MILYQENDGEDSPQGGKLEKTPHAFPPLRCNLNLRYGLVYFRLALNLLLSQGEA